MGKETQGEKGDSLTTEKNLERRVTIRGPHTTEEESVHPHPRLKRGPLKKRYTVSVPGIKEKN